MKPAIFWIAACSLSRRIAGLAITALYIVIVRTPADVAIQKVAQSEDAWNFRLKTLNLTLKTPPPCPATP
jgi:hypothetical protein